MDKNTHEATLVFRSIARISGDLLEKRPLDVEVSELVWAIMHMADTMADKLDGVAN